MRVRDRIYDSVIPAAIHLVIALLSFVLGLIILLGEYPSFFSAALVFALGFIFEYSIMIGDHVSKKVVNCKRIKIESLFGWISGLIIVVVSIIMIASGGDSTNYELLAVISIILSAIYIAIIGIEVCYNVKDYIESDPTIPPVTR